MRTFHLIRIEKVEERKKKDITEEFFRDYLREIKEKIEMKHDRAKDLLEQKKRGEEQQNQQVGFITLFGKELSYLKFCLRQN